MRGSQSFALFADASDISQRTAGRRIRINGSTNMIVSYTQTVASSGDGMGNLAWIDRLEEGSSRGSGEGGNRLTQEDMGLVEEKERERGEREMGLEIVEGSGRRRGRGEIS